MSRTVLTRDGDVFDLLALAAYGVTAGATEAVLDANPTLADVDAVLSLGLTVALPDFAVAVPTSPVVKLWD